MNIILILKIQTSNAVFSWKHLLGFIILPFNYFIFKFNHKIGVVGIGFTLLVGLVGLLSYTHAITTATYSVGKMEDFQIPIFHGQPIFLLWLLIDLSISGRHYFGVATKKYWVELLNQSFKKPSN